MLIVDAAHTTVSPSAIESTMHTHEESSDTLLFHSPSSS
jgi:hypothetical protein